MRSRVLLFLVAVFAGYGCGDEAEAAASAQRFGEQLGFRVDKVVCEEEGFGNYFCAVRVDTISSLFVLRCNRRVCSIIRRH